MVAMVAIKRAQVELLSGATARDKRFLIRGLTLEELTARVGKLLGDAE